MDRDAIDPPLKKFQKELSAGTVSLALLAVLGRAAEPMYGYQIAKTLERSGEGVLSGKQSALYPVLRNMEGAGLLESHVEPSVSGPPRRYYRITSAGSAPDSARRSASRYSGMVVGRTLAAWTVAFMRCPQGRNRRNRGWHARRRPRRGGRPARRR